MATSGGKLTDAAKARQARSKALDKQYRANAAKLKKLGVLTKRVNARAKITHSTRTKINKFRDVLEGRAIPVRAPKEIREAYRDKGTLDVRGPFVIAPKEFANQRARISRGMIQIVRPLKNGQEEYVILPWRANDLYDLVERMRDDPDALDNLKMADEYFSFRLYGHNATDAFPDTKELREHLQHYLSRLGSRNDVIKHITFQRFKGGLTEMGRNTHPSPEKQVPYNSNVDKKGRRRYIKGTYEKQRDARRAAAKAKQRANETPEERKKRLEKQRIRQAQYRQRKFENDL